MDHPNRVGLTAPSSDSSNRLATTAFVQNAISGVSAGVESIGGESGQITLGTGLAISGSTLATSPNPSYFPILNGETSYTISLADHLRTICGYGSSLTGSDLAVTLPSALTNTGLICFFTPSNNNIVLTTDDNTTTIQSSMGSPTSQTLHAGTNMTSLLTCVGGAFVLVNPSS